MADSLEPATLIPQIHPASLVFQGLDESVMVRTVALRFKKKASAILCLVLAAQKNMIRVRRKTTAKKSRGKRVWQRGQQRAQPRHGVAARARKALGLRPRPGWRTDSPGQIRRHVRKGIRSGLVR